MNETWCTFETMKQYCAEIIDVDHLELVLNDIKIWAQQHPQDVGNSIFTATFTKMMHHVSQ